MGCFLIVSEWLLANQLPDKESVSPSNDETWAKCRPQPRYHLVTAPSRQKDREIHSNCVRCFCLSLTQFKNLKLAVETKNGISRKFRSYFFLGGSRVSIRTIGLQDCGGVLEILVKGEICCSDWPLAAPFGIDASIQMLGIVTKDTCENQHFDGRLLSWWPVAPTSSTWCSCCHLNPPVSVEGMDIPMINFWSAAKNVCNIEYLVTQPVSPGNPGRCHGTCCQPYRPGIWRSGDHPSLQARALSQKGYGSNEWDGCIEVCIFYICVYISISVNDFKCKELQGTSAACATYIQRFFGRFMDVSLFQEL